ncbi:hypothetical protein KEM56_005336 [Ascosphaera pollenicola]|nr:hypothetical protein KEM56_005336 [Ascosphaera pollenicola]
MASEDDDVDQELVELLRQRMGLSAPKPKSGAHDEDTRVLQDAQFVVHNAIDVVIDPFKTKHTAEVIFNLMREKDYDTTKKWAEHPLHPTTRDETTVDFIFVMDLLNFSFWSDEADKEKQFAIEYKGKKWNGYSSLVGALQRALDEGVPITTPSFWIDEEKCSNEKLLHVFRSATEERIPMFDERVKCLREAGRILCDKYDGSFTNCIKEADGCAGYLVNLVADDFPCFRDTVEFKGKTIQIYKRAQILVADTWACFNGKGFGKFHDINKLTMFADYRVPQALCSLGCIRYSPPLEMWIRDKKEIPSGSREEVEIRASTIWCVDALRREILRRHPEAAMGNFTAQTSSPTTPQKEKNDDEKVKNGFNAVLIDFMLYDLAKERQETDPTVIPHHRTRSIWY